MQHSILFTARPLTPDLTPQITSFTIHSLSLLAFVLVVSYDLAGPSFYLEIVFDWAWGGLGVTSGVLGGLEGWRRGIQRYEDWVLRGRRPKKEDGTSRMKSTTSTNTSKRSPNNSPSLGKSIYKGDIVGLSPKLSPQRTVRIPSPGESEKQSLECSK